jgi:hypothetical protein
MRWRHFPQSRETRQLRPGGDIITRLRFPVQVIRQDLPAAPVIWPRTKYRRSHGPNGDGACRPDLRMQGFRCPLFFLANVGWSALLAGEWKLFTIPGTFKTARTLGFSEDLNSKIWEGCPI